MQVRLTRRLEEKLARLNINQEKFLESFIIYKSNPSQNNYVFGRDVGYHTYTVDDRYILKHVHLAPAQHPEAMVLWNKKHYSNQEKTSDASLVYIERNKGDFLLITIFEQPTAHEQCLNKPTMKRIQQIAEEFYFFGKVID